jgi:HK97 family phage portal protein
LGIFSKFFNKKKYVERYQPIVYSPFNMSGGSYITPDSAMKISAFYRGLLFISTQVAKLPFEIKGDENKRYRNNIYKLLNKKPNSETTSFLFKCALIQTAVSYGNSYAEIERTITGEPVALWFIPNEHITPYRTADGELVYRFTNSVSGEIWIPKEDILHIRNFHTRDGVMGQGVVAYGYEVLGISLGADKFANSLYDNAGIPSGVIETDSKLSDEAYSRIKSSWRDSMGGRKTGGTAILEEGLKYKPITLSPNILQFLESRQFGVLEMARFLGVPPSKLYDPTSQKYNNVEQSGLDVANDTISVWAINLEQEVDNKLLVGRYSSLESKLNIYDLFRADAVTRSNYFSKMVSIGAMTPNQVREQEGLEPYDGGDRYYISTNNFSPADRIDEIVDKQVSMNNGNPGMGDEGVQPAKADTNSGGVDNDLTKTMIAYMKAKIK